MRLLFALFAPVITLTLALPAGAQETIAYWAQNTNDLPGGGFGFTPASFPQAADDGALAGQAFLELGNFDQGVDGDDVYQCIPSFAGSTLNALPGFDSGGSLSPQGCTSGNTNNGMYVQIALSTEGFENLLLSWAQRGTASGFDSRQLSWSADGGDTFTDFGSDQGTLGSAWILQSYDLSAIGDLNDNPDVVFRITLDGATGTGTGNNRFDNIRLDGTSVGGGPGTAEIPYELEFSTDPYSDGWTAQDISGLENWAWNGSFGNVTFSAFDDGACTPSESWFISPGFDLDATEDERLFVDVQRGFSGDDNLNLYFSDDYTGEGDPNLATWTLLQEVTPADFSSNNTPVTFGPFFEIRDGAGTGYFAARGKYDGGSCSTWRISRFEIDLEPPPPEGFACYADPGDDAFATRIHAVQGDGFESPIAGPNPGEPGDSVQVQAIVVGVFQDTAGGEIGGFFLQEPDDRADGDPLTSEGIRVSPAGAGVTIPALEIGDEVRVYGSVREEFGQTEIFQLGAFEHCAAGQLSRVAPAEVELPVADLLDLESLEGMWVRLPQALAVSEVFNAARFAEFVVAPERLFTPTQVAAPGPDAIAVQELNDLSRLIIDEGKAGSYVTPYQPGLDGTPLDASNPIRVGYRIQADFDGIMGFAFSNYRVYSLQPAVFDDAENPRGTPPELSEGNLRVASINVENLFSTIQTGGVGCGPNNLDCRGATSVSELERQLDKLTTAILELGVDVAGLVEVENDDDDSTLQLLVDQLNDIDDTGDWTYVATGWAGTDAIKNAIIYRTGKAAPLGDFVLLDSSVDVIPPFDDSRQRPVLTQAFEHIDDGGVFTLSVVHLRSKSCGSNASGGNQDQGDGQGCWNLLRTESVQSFRNWLATDPTGAGTGRHIVMGDFNAYAQEDPLQVLVDEGYVNQQIDANGGDPAVYSYVFQGQSGSLDHTLASPDMDALVLGAANWAINADEIPAFGYPETLPNSSLPKPADFYQADPYRSSDHDPLVISVQVAPAVAGIFIEGLEQVYTGDPLPVTATTEPAGLEVEITYDGLTEAPVDAGSYEVVATVINSTHYAGSETATLVILPAAAGIEIDGLEQVYTGDPLPVAVTTDPAGLPVEVTYDGEAEAPVDAGGYQVVVTVTDPNHDGGETAVLTIEPAQAGITFGDLQQVYTGDPLPVSVVTAPAGLAVEVTYDGEAGAPVDAGTYEVEAVIIDPNHVGGGTEILVIEPASAGIAFESLQQVHTGAPLSPTVVTEPPGLDVTLTFDGDPSAPSEVGDYAVQAVIDERNYTGTASALFSILPSADVIFQDRFE